VLAVVFALALAGAIGFEIGMRRSTGAGAQLARIRPAPTYRLTNQLGDPVRSSSFAGKVQIVTFLFPYCTTYCPLIAADLVRLEGELAGSGLGRRVQIVAFNVDPTGSGAPQMRAFMKEYGWNPADTRWQYLTGSAKAIHHAVYDGYMVAYQRVTLAQEARDEARERAQGVDQPQPVVENRLAETSRVGYDVVHNDVLEIVGPRGEIREIDDDAARASSAHLISVIRTLLR
jgi:protein SCO1/2